MNLDVLHEPLSPRFASEEVWLCAKLIRELPELAAHRLIQLCVEDSIRALRCLRRLQTATGVNGRTRMDNGVVVRLTRRAKSSSSSVCAGGDAATEVSSVCIG